MADRSSTPVTFGFGGASWDRLSAISFALYSTGADITAAIAHPLVFASLRIREIVRLVHRRIYMRAITAAIKINTNSNAVKCLSRISRAARR